MQFRSTFSAFNLLRDFCLDDVESYNVTMRVHKEFKMAANI